MKHIIHFILLSIFLFTNQLNANEALAKLENDKKQIYDIGGHFKLTDQNGKIFESDKVTQPYLLVFFGYGTCKSTCPTALNELTNFMKQNKNFIHKVQPVFISLESSKDTPEKLKNFGKPYDQNIRMLTSTDENREEYIQNLKLGNNNTSRNICFIVFAYEGLRQRLFTHVWCFKFKKIN